MYDVFKKSYFHCALEDTLTAYADIDNQINVYGVDLWTCFSVNAGWTACGLYFLQTAEAASNKLHDSL